MKNAFLLTPAGQFFKCEIAQLCSLETRKLVLIFSRPGLISVLRLTYHSKFHLFMCLLGSKAVCNDCNVIRSNDLMQFVNASFFLVP